MNRRLLLLVVLLGALHASAEARAQSTTEPLWKRWYGWQLALADGAALGLVLAPLEDNARGAALGVGMTGLFFNGAIVHMANRNPVAASRGLLRLPAFLAGRLVGWAAGNLLCKETGCKDPIEDWSGYVGLGAMVTYDHVMAWRPERSFWADGGRTGGRPPRLVARAPGVPDGVRAVGVGSRTGPAPARGGVRVLALPLYAGSF